MGSGRVASAKHEARPRRSDLRCAGDLCVGLCRGVVPLQPRPHAAIHSRSNDRSNVRATEGRCRTRRCRECPRIARQCAGVCIGIPQPRMGAQAYVSCELKVETLVQSSNDRCCLFCPNHELGWHYNDVGQGRPLLLLHGIGMSHVAWKMIIPDLAKERRVLAFDIAGFGSTPTLTDIQPSPVNLVASLAETLRKIDEERQISAEYNSVDVVGNSLGGYMALEAAKLGKLARFRVNSVVALSPAGLWRKRFPFRSEIVLQVTRLGTGLFPRLTHALLRREHTRRLLMAIPASPEVPEEDALDLVNIFASASVFASKAALRNFRESMKAPFSGGKTISRNIRVTITFGKRDLLLPPSARLRHEIPENVIWREGQDRWAHVPMWDDPEGVTKLILEGTA